MGGETLLHQRYRHPALAQGKPVLYAGEANFNNGKLEWWSNGSGNYRPDADHAAQSGLPMNQFYPYKDILKGIHKRGKPLEMPGALLGSAKALYSVQAKMANGPGLTGPTWYRRLG